jgi:hypothetical protein
MTPEWAALVDHVSARQLAARRGGSRLWYRGQSDGWPLRSRLHRHFKDVIDAASQADETEPEELLRVLRETEKSLFLDHLSRAWPIIPPHQVERWGFLFWMQHHGIPTRLLDWSESFACALFFALRYETPKAGCCLFILDPQALNADTVGRDGMVFVSDAFQATTLDLSPYHPLHPTLEHVRPVAVVPPLATPRMSAQRAGFVITGHDFTPLEQQVTSRAVLEKLPLPETLWQDARAFLDLADFGHYAAYPDPEGLLGEFRETEAWQLGEAREMGRAAAPPPTGSETL